MRKLGEAVESVAPPVRRREVTWQDPLVSAALARDLSGLDYLLGIAEGRFPPPPIAALLGMSIVSVEPGQVTFGLDVGEHLYNPIGSVHGGVFCTLLDSAMGCAVHASLDRGQAYTTLELKVNIVKALTLNTPSVTATGQVISAGRRVATASGQITGPDGALYAHATTTCLVVRAAADGGERVFRPLRGERPWTLTPAPPGPALDAGSLEEASAFLRAAGLVVDEVTASRVTGHLQLSPEHHTPWGIVHGGVYTTAIESAASIGASSAVRPQGQVAVGLTNTTHFLRSLTAGRVNVEAAALSQGRTQQLWRVDITDESGRLIAHGEVRLQNVAAT